MDLTSSVQHFLLLAEIDGGNWVYVLFAIIYVIVQLFSNKNKAGDEEEATSEDKAAAEARRRQIQEEIQRRIRERVGGSSAGDVRTSPGDARETAQPAQPVSRSREQPSQETIRKASPSGSRQVEAVGRMESIEAQLKDQAERLKKSQRARDRAVKKAASISGTARSIGSEKEDVQRRGELRGLVMRSLKERKSLKAAIVLNEVMGKPMGLREEVGPYRD